MPILKDQRRILLQHGFTKYEIDWMGGDLAKRPAVFDLTHPKWQLALEHRATYWLKELGKLKKKGYTIAEAQRRVTAKINRAYTNFVIFAGKRGVNSPWDFIRAEYKLGYQPKTLRDFHLAAQNRLDNPARVRANAESARADKLARDRQARVSSYARAKMRE